MKFLISVIDTGQNFHCSEQQHLLQGMQTCQIGAPLLKSIPVGCRGGGCGVCRIRIQSGEYEVKKMSRKHVTEQEQLEGVALACRVYPCSDLGVVLLPLGQSENNEHKREISK
jgi:ferredoxin